LKPVGTKQMLARQAGATEADVKLYRQTFPVAATDAKEIPDSATRAFRFAIAGRVTDGLQLYWAIQQSKPLPQTSVPLSNVAAVFAKFCAQLYTEPNHDSAWNPRQLLFQFSVASAPAGRSPVTLTAPDFRGDRLDWYSFDPCLTQIASPAQQPANAHAATSFTAFKFLPTNVTFRGGPNPRWWQFEDAQTDFGALDLEKVDLAKMVLVEFGTIYGHDWFLLPLPLRVGALSKVDALVITDSFGYRTLIESAETGSLREKARVLGYPMDHPLSVRSLAKSLEDSSRTSVSAPISLRRTLPSWSIFRVSDGQTHLNSLFIPPSLGIVQDGPAVEEVLFLRDEMAEMAWGVEKKIMGPLGKGVDGYEAWRLRLGDDGPLSAPSTSSDADIYYVFQTTVPDNWIPLLPVQSPRGGRYFRRGYIPSRTGDTPIAARTAILDPGRPYFVNDHAVPGDGIDVRRYFRRARWLNGETVIWMARRTGHGRGPGWSGLAYDLIVPKGKTPADVLR